MKSTMSLFATVLVLTSTSAFAVEPKIIGTGLCSAGVDTAVYGVKYRTHENGQVEAEIAFVNWTSAAAPAAAEDSGLVNFIDVGVVANLATFNNQIIDTESGAICAQLKAGSKPGRPSIKNTKHCKIELNERCEITFQSKSPFVNY